MYKNGAQNHLEPYKEFKIGDSHIVDKGNNQ